MKTKALFTALSKKLKDNEIIFVDSLSFTKPKTAEAKKVVLALSNIKGFDTLATKRKNTALFALGKKDKNTKMSFRNFGNVSVDEARNLNPVDVLRYKYLVLTNPKESVDILNAKHKDSAYAKASADKQNAKETNKK